MQGWIITWKWTQDLCSYESESAVVDDKNNNNGGSDPQLKNMEEMQDHFNSILSIIAKTAKPREGNSGNGGNKAKAMTTNCSKKHSSEDHTFRWNYRLQQYSLLQLWWVGHEHNECPSAKNTWTIQPLNSRREEQAQSLPLRPATLKPVPQNSSKSLKGAIII